MAKLLLSVSQACWGINEKKCTANFYEEQLEIILNNGKTINYEYAKMTEIAKYGPVIINFSYDGKFIRLVLPREKIDNCLTIMNQTADVDKLAEEVTEEKNKTKVEEAPKDNTPKTSEASPKEPTNKDGIIGLIAVLVIIGVIFFGIKSLFFSNSSTKDEENKTEEKVEEENLDKMAGRWYDYDEYGLKNDTSYIEIDGKGHFFYRFGDYVFHKDEGVYVIDGDDIKFYTDSTKTSLWEDCSLMATDKMLCVKRGSNIYQR